MGFHGCAADSTVIGIKSICLCLLLPVCGLGQSPLTALSAGDAVERALRQHPILTADRARVQVAEGRRQQLSLRPNPRLYLQNENARVGGGSSPFRFSQETDTFAYASQVFESAGKRDRRVELATEILRGRQLEVDDRRARIALNVLNAYGPLPAPSGSGMFSKTIWPFSSRLWNTTATVFVKARPRRWI